MISEECTLLWGFSAVLRKPCYLHLLRGFSPIPEHNVRWGCCFAWCSATIVHVKLFFFTWKLSIPALIWRASAIASAGNSVEGLQPAHQQWCQHYHMIVAAPLPHLLILFLKQMIRQHFFACFYFKCSTVYSWIVVRRRRVFTWRRIGRMFWYARS